MAYIVFATFFCIVASYSASSCSLGYSFTLYRLCNLLLSAALSRVRLLLGLIGGSLGGVFATRYATLWHLLLLESGYIRLWNRSDEFSRMRKRIARMLTVKRERELEEGINKRLSRKLDRKWKKSIVFRPPPSLKKMHVEESEQAKEAEKYA